MKQVLANAMYVNEQDPRGTYGGRLLFLGPDDSGRILEVVAIWDETQLNVIHAMDIRPKNLRILHERGER